ncbi:hypothetical protein [Lebetimonas sp. JS085]|nr:hypothetical protein [Lebetimonas sp. JS085]
MEKISFLGEFEKVKAFEQLRVYFLQLHYLKLIEKKDNNRQKEKGGN